MNYSLPEKFSSCEAELAAIMQRDAAVIAARCRASNDAAEPLRKRRPPSAETRAKLAAAASRRKLSAETRAKIAATQSKRLAQLKSQSVTAPPMTSHRRTAHG